MRREKGDPGRYFQGLYITGLLSFFLGGYSPNGTTCVEVEVKVEVPCLIGPIIAENRVYDVFGVLLGTEWRQSSSPRSVRLK